MPALPTPAEYSEAIQAPSIAFEDLELKGGQPEVTPMGLPRPISGNFATVFRITSQGGRVWAVKCFTREVPDQHRRYEAVSAAVHSLNAPFLVGFEYLSAGIRVQGRMYPVVKMEWFRADLLGNWIEQHRFSPERLLRVGASLITAVQKLENAGIAHGDLQHGNILVDSNDQVRLIDYDGMYVPALKGMPPAEEGHRHYQHPKRATQGFGPQVDRFSLNVIWLSLLALSHDPYLWDRYADAGEHLLFTADDYRRADMSQVVHELRVSAPELAQQVGALFGASLADLALPSPVGAPTERAVGQQSKDWLTQAPSTSATERPPQWINQSPGAADAQVGAPQAAAAKDWMVSHLPPLPAQSFSRVAGIRVATIGLVLAALFCLLVLAPIGVPLAAVAATLAVVVWVLVLEIQYRRDAAVRTRRELRSKREQSHVEHSKLRERLDTEEKARGAIQSRERARLQELYARVESSRKKIAQQRSQIETSLQNRLADISKRQNEFEASVKAREQAKLASIVEQSIQSALSSARISDSIANLGSSSVYQLRSSGFQSAADFTGYRLLSSRYGANGKAELKRPNGSFVYVYSVGPTRARALEQWRNGVLARAKRSAPTTLPPEARKALDAERTSKLSALASERASCTSAAERQRAAPVAAEMEIEKLQKEILEVQAQSSAQRFEVDQRINTLATEVRNADRAAQRADREYQPYAALSRRRLVRRAIVG